MELETFLHLIQFGKISDEQNFLLISLYYLVMLRSNIMW